MSGLAVVAHALGATISGSDRAAWPAWAHEATGYEPTVGHAAENVPEGATVVYSTAIKPDNPERTTGAPELHRADLLGEITRLKPTIAVSGTHGKTTTSSMLVHALRGAGADPSYLVGGEVRSTGANAGWAGGGVARRRGRRVRPQPAQAGAHDRGGHQRGTRPPHDLRVPARRRRDVHGLPGAVRSTRVVPPELTALAAGPTVFEAEPELSASGSTLRRSTAFP